MRVDPKSLYKVTMTEYDNGVQRPMGTEFFTTEAEAKAFCLEYAAGSYDCYYRASYERIN